MIVEFSVKNFRSIKDLQTISFVATPLGSAKDYASVDENNIVEEGGMKLLKTVGIYGANASGKSNVIKAFHHFLDFVTRPAQPNPNLEDVHQPFVYQENSFDTESFFQIVFIMDNKKFRYGFTVKNEIVTSEWLYGPSNKNSVAYFIRSSNKTDIRESFKEAMDVPPLEHQHNLFLSHVAAYRKGEASKIYHYFFLRIISGNSRLLSRAMTLEHLANSDGHKEILKLLQNFGIKYDEIVLEDDINKSSVNVNAYPLEKISVIKRGIKLNMGFHESDGVAKLFDMLGFLRFSFFMGFFWVQDELDSNFHPSLLIKLIQMYNDPKINTGKGQLLFTTHDTNLLDPSIMRRDQFYFTEKDSQDATRLYSLADLKGIRNDADFAKQYLAGAYGALPVLDNYLTEETTKANG